MKKKWGPVLLGALLLGAVAAYLVFTFVYNKPHPDYSKKEATVSVEAEELYSIFTRDKALADSEYSGMFIEVNGVVSNYETTDSNFVINFVFNEGMFGDEGVRCITLTKTKQVIEEGQPIKLKGLCIGYNETDVILEKCTLLK